MNFVRVSELIGDKRHDMGLEPVGKPPLKDGRINEVQIHKLGLLLTGVDVTVHPMRIQLLGRSENVYLKHLDPQGRAATAKFLNERGVQCVVITRNLKAPREFVDGLLKSNVCLLKTRLKSDEFIRRATDFLIDRLAPRLTVHGVFLDTFGVGVMLIGKGGIGKSECALDLVHKGHRLVADDVVELIRLRDSIIGQCSPVIGHHMEIRGLGIINIKDLYGIAAVRKRKRVDLVIELIEWSRRIKLTALGFEDDVFEILGVNVAHIRLPVLPGKNLSVLVEVAARNHLLKMDGHDSAKEFQKNIGKQIAAAERTIILPGEEVE